MTTRQDASDRPMRIYYLDAPGEFAVDPAEEELTIATALIRCVTDGRVIQITGHHESVRVSRAAHVFRVEVARSGSKRLIHFSGVAHKGQAAEGPTYPYSVEWDLAFETTPLRYTEWGAWES